MENIDGFLSGARSVGIRDNKLFTTLDCYEKSDMKKVVFQQ